MLPKIANSSIFTDGKLPLLDFYYQRAKDIDSHQNGDLVVELELFEDNGLSNILLPEGLPTGKQVGRDVVLATNERTDLPDGKNECSNSPSIFYRPLGFRLACCISDLWRLAFRRPGGMR